MQWALLSFEAPKTISDTDNVKEREGYYDLQRRLNISSSMRGQYKNILRGRRREEMTNADEIKSFSKP